MNETQISEIEISWKFIVTLNLRIIKTSINGVKAREAIRDNFINFSMNKS